MCSILFSSCQHKKPHLIVFFDDLSEVIPDKKLDAFAKKKLDSAGTTIELIRHDVKQEMLQLPSNSSLKNYLDSLTGGDNDAKVNFLSVGFHFYLNDRKIEYPLIRKEIIKMLDHTYYEYGKEVWKEKMRIAAINNEKFHEGDTINALLEVSDHFGKNSVVYSDGIVDETDSNDLMSLSGVILSKGFVKWNPDGVDSTSITFRLKVIDLGQNDVSISLGKTIALGDTINLYVTEYGRLLKGTDSD